ERNKVFAHNDMPYLERLLAHATKSGMQGKLVVTDGVFSMHGELAPLPELAEVCRRHCARLMVDDAHGPARSSATSIACWRLTVWPPGLRPLWRWFPSSSSGSLFEKRMSRDRVSHASGAERVRRRCVCSSEFASV